MKLMFNLKNQEKSFTIIELLVVIAVIGLLAAIVIVAISGVRERAQLSRTASWAATNHRMLSADNVLNLNFDNCLPNTTPTSFTDLSGLNNHGTCTGVQCPACAEGVPGVTGRAVSFDGVDDFIEVPHSASLNIFNEVTITIWVMFNTLTVGQGIVDKRRAWNEPSGYGLIFDFTTVNGIEARGRAFNHARSFPGELITGRWYHIVGTLSNVGGATLNKVYINGINRTLSRQNTEPLQNNNLSIRIGIRTAGERFNGLMDDVRIYSAAVPLSYIQEQYVQGLQSLLANNAITEQEYNQRMSEFNQHLVKE